MKQKLCIRNYVIKSQKKIGEGRIRLVFLTDLHNKIEGTDRTRLFRCIERCQPDLVLVGGDVLVGKPGQGIGTAVRFIKELAERYPVWYGNGNHEQRIYEHPEVYQKMGIRYEEAIQKTKAVRLRNQRADVEIKGIPLSIYGLNGEERFYDKGWMRKPGMLEEIQRNLGEKPEKESYSILLAHSPRYGKEYLAWGADLTLSGHYHGGVMLLGKKMGLITPDFRMFSRMCCGIRGKGESRMIVSAGVGEHTLPFRIHNPREVTCIELVFGEG